MYKLSFIILVVTLMGIIFLFSSYDAQASSVQSQMIVDFINKYVPTNSSYIRKLAHFSLFFVLEMILYTGLKIYMVRNPGLYSILVVSIYAISDEIHQYFVPGRSCELRDMMIDICGGICALIIIKMWEVFAC